MGWKKIGTAANSLAIYANRLVALTPDCKRVFMRDPSTLKWEQIGGPAKSIIGGAWDLYAESPNGKKVYRYDGKDWSEISDGAIQFVGIGNALYKLMHGTRDVYRFNRYKNDWSKIGGAAHSIIGGGSKVYASTTDRGEIYEYSRFKDKWTKIGGAGHSWVGVGGTVYGLAPNKKAVYRYNGTPGNWTKVGGSASELIGGGSFLYAVNPGTKNIWKYSDKDSKWTEMGTHGVEKVASGNRLYSMTPNKKEVYEYTSENNESKRLKKLLYNAFKQEKFGKRIMRGFLVKEFGGKILAENNADVIYQPLSTLKLVPYFHAISEIDKGKSYLKDTKVNWLGLIVGTNDSKNAASCLVSTDANVTPANAYLEHALPTMMWFSHNRTLDAVMSHYGIKQITQRVQDLGLKQTEMYYGCSHLDIPDRHWLSNMTTLNDMAKLFEGVDNLEFIDKTTSREIWRTNMIQGTSFPGTTYISPILLGANNNMARADNEYIRALVGEVAGPAKMSIVDEFMKSVSFIKKGGGVSGFNETGQCDFREVSLPFKENSEIVIKKFLMGHYLHQRRDVKDNITTEQSLMRNLEIEMYRIPIKKALSTW